MAAEADVPWRALSGGAWRVPTVRAASGAKHAQQMLGTVTTGERIRISQLFEFATLISAAAHRRVQAEAVGIGAQHRRGRRLGWEGVDAPV